MVRETWTAAGCLAYARCSGELQEDSVSDQLRILEGARKELGLALLHPAFADEARRGYDEERAGLKALLDFVRAHPRRPEKNSEYVPVIISSTDRFGRFLDPITIFSYLKILHEHGYELFSVSERLRSRGDLSSFIQLAVKADQASEYSANLSYHTMKGMVSKAQRGFWMGATLRTGLTASPSPRAASPSTATAACRAAASPSTPSTGASSSTSSPSSKTASLGRSTSTRRGRSA